MPQTGEAAAPAARTQGLTVMPGAEKRGAISPAFMDLVAKDRAKRAAKRTLKHAYEWPGNPWGASRPSFQQDCIDDATTDDPANCQPFTYARYKGTANVYIDGTTNGWTQTVFGNSPRTDGPAANDAPLSGSYFHMSVGAEGVQTLPGSGWGFDIYQHCRQQMGVNVSFHTIVFNDTYSQRYSNTYIRPMIGLAANGMAAPGVPYRSACVYSMLQQGTDTQYGISSALLTYWGQYNWGANGL